jgi:hypothetical protein
MNGHINNTYLNGELVKVKLSDGNLIILSDLIEYLINQNIIDKQKLIEYIDSKELIKRMNENG